MGTGEGSLVERVTLHLSGNVNEEKEVALKGVAQQRKQQAPSHEVGRRSERSRNGRRARSSPTPSDVDFPLSASLVLGTGQMKEGW